MYRRILFAVLFLLLPSVTKAEVPSVDKPVAVLRALNKITARVEELQVPINQPLTFGTLSLTVKACRVAPPEETPEAAAYLDVSELKPGQDDVAVFHGWMFASSPALSAMEHPVYDIWVTGCKDSSTK